MSIKEPYLNSNLSPFTLPHVAMEHVSRDGIRECTKFKKYEEEARTYHNGYPMFNGCNHTFVDLSHLNPKNSEGEDNHWMHTFSVKLPDGNFVTMCVMQSSISGANVDVQFYKGSKPKKNTRVMGMNKGKSDNIYNTSLVAVITED